MKSIGLRDFLIVNTIISPSKDIHFHLNTALHKAYTMKIAITILSVIALSSTFALAGPISWGLCQTACNAGYCVCCTAAGAVAGMSHLAETSIQYYKLSADA